MPGYSSRCDAIQKVEKKARKGVRRANWTKRHCRFAGLTSGVVVKVRRDICYKHRRAVCLTRGMMKSIALDEDDEVWKMFARARGDSSRARVYLVFFSFNFFPFFTIFIFNRAFI